MISLREEANKKGKGRLIKTVAAESNDPKISLIEQDFFSLLRCSSQAFGDRWDISPKLEATDPHGPARRVKVEFSTISEQVDIHFFPFPLSLSILV